MQKIYEKFDPPILYRNIIVGSGDRASGGVSVPRLSIANLIESEGKEPPNEAIAGILLSTSSGALDRRTRTTDNLLILV